LSSGESGAVFNFKSLKAAAGFGDQQEQIEAAPVPSGSLTQRLHEMIADLDAGEKLYQERLHTLKKTG
jgi:hypothetical protein